MVIWNKKSTEKYCFIIIAIFEHIPSLANARDRKVPVLRQAP